MLTPRPLAPESSPVATRGEEPTTSQALRVACSSCNLRELCLPVGLSEPELQRLDTLVAARRSACTRLPRCPK